VLTEDLAVGLRQVVRAEWLEQKGIDSQDPSSCVIDDQAVARMQDDMR
jgi:hypothetical protein